MVGKNLLVIDDEISASEVAGKSPEELVGYMSYYLQDLREAGYEVTPARGVDEALELLAKTQDFDLVIVDIMMPPEETFETHDTARGMRTGLFLIQTVHEQWPKLRILILSNAVPSIPSAPHQAKYQELIENRVVEKVLFKLDVTPGDLVREIQDLS